jgi:monomeric isocitrate dehydrogenase
MSFRVRKSVSSYAPTKPSEDKEFTNQTEFQPAELHNNDGKYRYVPYKKSVCYSEDASCQEKIIYDKKTGKWVILKEDTSYVDQSYVDQSYVDQSYVDKSYVNVKQTQ